MRLLSSDDWSQSRLFSANTAALSSYICALCGICCLDVQPNYFYTFVYFKTVEEQNNKIGSGLKHFWFRCWSQSFFAVASEWSWWFLHPVYCCSNFSTVSHLQEDNGIPVHLKGGTSDALLYRATMVLTVVGEKNLSSFSSASNLSASGCIFKIH